MNRRATLAFTLVGFLWGSAWIPTTEILKQIPQLRAGALRFAIAAVFTALLALIARLRHRKTPARCSAAILRDALVLSLTALALPYAIIIWASPHLSPAAVPVLFALVPLIALLMSREAESSAIPALVIGTCGVALVVAPALSFSPPQLGATLLVFCAVVLWAYSLKYAKKHLRSPDLLVSSSIQLAIAAIALATTSLATEGTQLSVPNTSTILCLLSLGILISGITLPLLYWLLTRVEVWQAALLQWISTLIAVAEAAWLLRVRPSPGQAIGALAIIGAVVWLLSHREPVTSPATSLRFEAPPHRSLK
jgi:drug/metabolite transporter (DMT)-like permease